MSPYTTCYLRISVEIQYCIPASMAEGLEGGISATKVKLRKAATSGQIFSGSSLKSESLKLEKCVMMVNLGHLPVSVIREDN